MYTPLRGSREESFLASSCFRWLWASYGLWLHNKCPSLSLLCIFSPLLSQISVFLLQEHQSLFLEPTQIIQNDLMSRFVTPSAKILFLKCLLHPPVPCWPLAATGLLITFQEIRSKVGLLLLQETGGQQKENPLSLLSPSLSSQAQRERVCQVQVLGKLQVD